MKTLNSYITYLNKWIVDYCHNAHTEGVVVGISGGVDSAVVAAIADMHKKIKVMGV
jgi:NAD+ synthase